jgi:parallel beta-helix repeat protein
MTTVYVSPAGSGDRSGSSAENAKPFTSLDSAIQQAGPGGTVNLLADKGAYNLTGSITISHGGSDSAPVTIQGVSSTGAAMDITINGTRDPNWTATSTAAGNTIFKLVAGANNLDFENMHFNNVGMAFDFGANIHNVTLGHMYADNVRYFAGNYPLNGATSADIVGLTMNDIEVHGFSKSVLILKGNASDIRLNHVYGDGEYQDGDRFEMGISLQDTVHDVIIQNTTMKNCIADIATTGNYTNGDGFTSELGVYNVQYINCTATGNGDGGFDLKSSNTTLTDCYAEDNKRNYRLWGHDVTLTDCAGVDPHKRILTADGTQCNIWVDAGAKNIKVVGGYFADSGSATDVVHSDGGSVSLNGAAIWHASNGDLQSGSGISGIDMSLVHLVAATGSYSTNGDQYLPTSIDPGFDPAAKSLTGTAGGDTIPPTTADHWTITALAGNDTITTVGGNDKIFGGAGNDVISTGAGNDMLQGGSNVDTMTGGAGADLFVFKSVAESKPGAGDLITDFAPGADKLDLSAIDANTKVSGDQAFAFLGVGTFTGHAGELRIDHTDPSKTVITADINGDKIADFQVTLTGHVDLTSGDFIF